MLASGKETILQNSTSRPVGLVQQEVLDLSPETENNI